MPELVPLEKAAAAEALHERLGNASGVARALDMPRTTVSDIINGHNRWSEVRFDASYVALRQEQKRILQVAGTQLLGKALIQIDKRLPDCSAPQAAMVYGVLFDKDRLMSGEPTEIIGHIQDRRSVESLEALAEALGQALIARNPGDAVGATLGATDVTPAPNSK